MLRLQASLTHLPASQDNQPSASIVISVAADLQDAHRDPCFFPFAPLGGPLLRFIRLDGREQWDIAEVTGCAF